MGRTRAEVQNVQLQRFVRGEFFKLVGKSFQLVAKAVPTSQDPQ
jgi:hypothetical protein